MLVVERCYNGIHFLFLSRKNVAFSNLRLQAVSVVVYVAFEMGLLKARSVVLAGCTESNFKEQ